MAAPLPPVLSSSAQRGSMKGGASSPPSKKQTEKEEERRRKEERRKTEKRSARQRRDAQEGKEESRERGKGKEKGRERKGSREWIIDDLILFFFFFRLDGTSPSTASGMSSSASHGNISGLRAFALRRGERAAGGGGGAAADSASAAAAAAALTRQRSGSLPSGAGGEIPVVLSAPTLAVTKANGRSSTSGIGESLSADSLHQSGKSSSYSRERSPSISSSSKKTSATSSGILSAGGKPDSREKIISLLL